MAGLAAFKVQIPAAILYDNTPDAGAAGVAACSIDLDLFVFKEKVFKGLALVSVSAADHLSSRLVMEETVSLNSSCKLLDAQSSSAADAALA